MPFEIREVATPSPVSPRAEQSTVRTRDGVGLATDVYLPDGAPTCGAVLVRGPYDKSSDYQAVAHMAEIFNEHGLAVVSQDVRGKFRSEGEVAPYLHDVDDAYDTVEWITGQAWSNGSVGLFGVSYLGFTVWAGVASGHPAIKGAVPQGTGIDMGAAHVGSLWRQEPPPALAADDLVQIWSDTHNHYLTIDYAQVPLRKALYEFGEQTGMRSSGLDALFRRAESGEWFNPYGGRHPYWTTNIPVLHWSNWFDWGLGPWGLRDFIRFRSIPGRRDLHYLRSESADHEGIRLADVPYAEEDHPWVNSVELRRVAHRQAEDAAAFLRPLLGRPGSLPDARVRWEMGNAGWHTAHDWPPPGLETRRWFLADGAAAADSAAGGALAAKPDSERTTVTWQHDPANPVGSTVTPDEYWTLLAAFPDERDFGDRRDVLSFTGEPLEHDVDLCGSALLHVRVSTSGPSTHLFARLQDVHPDGTVRPVTTGRVLLYAPQLEDVVQVDFDPHAYRFARGHRLRLHVASSDFPLYARHPGTAENPWEAEHFEVNEQRLLLGGLDAARLELPIYAAGGRQQ